MVDYKLTPRQYRLYDLLKSDPNKWWTQEEICKNISSYYYSDDDRNHCVAIGTDRIEINESGLTDKIIVTKKHCFKIATLEEYLKERASHIARIKSQVSIVRAMDRKYEQNGQGKLFNNILEELKPENEQYHETFMPKEPLPHGVFEMALVNYANKYAVIVKMRKYEFDEDKQIVNCIDENNKELKFSCVNKVVSVETLQRPFYEGYHVSRF